MKPITSFPAFLLPLLLLAAPLPCQGELAPLVKEQARLEERFRYLQDLMKRLAARYSAEAGEEHHKNLLQAGLDFIRSSKIENLLLEAKNDLDAGRTFSARKKQKEAQAKLQELYDLLLERRRTRDFQKEVERQEENLKAIEDLLSRQKDLQEKTRKALEKSLSPEEKALLARLDALIRKQESLASKTESLQPPGTAALEDLLRELKALSEKVAALRKNLGPQGKGRTLLEEVKKLLARQKALGSSLSKGEKAREEAARLRSLAARARALPPKGLARESDAALLAAEASRAASAPGAPLELKKALEEFRKLAGDPKAANRISSLLEKAAARKDREGAAAAEEARKAFQDQARAVEKAASKAGRIFPGAAKHLEKASKRNLSAAKEAGSGRQDQAAAWNEQALLELEQALAALQAEGADPGRTMREAASKAESLARRLQEEGVSPSGARLTKEAASKLDEGSFKADRKDWKGAGEDARAAQARLDRVVQALSKKLAGKTAGVLAAAKKTAQEQSELRKEARDLRNRIEKAAARGKLSPAQEEGASSAVSEAEKAMDQARKALSGARLEGARKAQRKASAALSRAKDALRKAHRPGRKTREELNRLAREQEEIRKRILQLARRMDPRKDREPKQDLSQAARSASRAKENLQSGDPQEARKNEEKTRRKLEEARMKVARKRDHYLSLRQEELLLNMKQELQKLLASHREIQRETKQVNLRIEERNGLVGRATRRALRRLASREKDLAESCSYIRKNLEKEGSLVFSRVLLEVEQDLGEVARLLTSRPPVTGTLTQGIQEDVARSLERLLGALKREVARRKKSRRTPSSNRGPGKNRLVPRVAELKMLKALQEDLMQRTRNLEEEAGVPGAESLIQAELERLANKQNDINQVFQTFLKQLGLGKPSSPAIPGKEGEKEKKGK